MRAKRIPLATEVRGSPRERIRSYPHSGRKESVWFKIPGDPVGLFPGKMVHRSRNQVNFDRMPMARSALHTHLPNARRNTVWPSPADLYEVLYALGKGHATRFWHIALVNGFGETKGLLTLHATNRLVKAAHSSDLLKLRWILHRHDKGKPVRDQDGKPLFSSERHLMNHANEVLEKAGLKIRVTPQKGYRFVNGHFVSEKIKPPVRKPTTK